MARPALRRLLLAGGALGLGALLWWGGPAGARRLPVFRVRRVEVRGATFLGAAPVVRALALRRDASIFDPAAPLVARVERLTGVRGARVGRRLPGTLVVTVDEVPPVALVASGTALAMMDARGRLLPYDPARAPADLPVVPAGDAAVGRLLARLRDASPEFFARVQGARRIGDDVALELERTRVLARPGTAAETFRQLQYVERDLGRRGRAYDELDVRFAGQVVVRRTRG